MVFGPASAHRPSGKHCQEEVPEKKGLGGIYTSVALGRDVLKAINIDRLRGSIDIGGFQHAASPSV